jgi:small conductance mechanosensitive channel
MLRVPILEQAAILAITIALASAPRIAEAQSPAAASATDAEAPEPASIDADELRLRLIPRTKEELEGDADAWMAHLKDAATAVADARLAGDDARAAELELTRSAVARRMSIVVDALERKGGEVGRYRAYIGAVTATTVDVTDAGAVWTTVFAWLKSPTGGIALGKRLLLCVVIIVAFAVLGRIVGALVRRALERFGRATTLLIQFLAGLAQKAILFVGIVVGVGALGVPMGPFLAAIGAAGLVVGLALQGTLSNFASGIMILLYRPYDIGDDINAGGVTGSVRAMTIVSTTLHTPDNQIVIVPNNSIWGGVITNMTGNPTRRIDMTFGIGYRDDIEKARSILRDVVTSHPLVLADPAPVIEVSELADSSVNFICRPWARTGDYWRVRFDVIMAVKNRFDAEGVSIPFPQRDVHVHQAPV